MIKSFSHANLTTIETEKILVRLFKNIVSLQAIKLLEFIHQVKHKFLKPKTNISEQVINQKQICKNIQEIVREPNQRIKNVK